jgi:hypothetical protein
VFRAGKLLANERYTVRYDPQNAIVEVGPPKQPAATRKKTTTPAPPEAPSDGTATTGAG